MNDRIENFIRDNRNEFDSHEPSDRVWKNVEKSIFPKNSLWNSVSLWRAAAVIFMALSVYLMIPKSFVGVQDRTVMKEFNDVEAFYVRQISDKVELIDSFERSEGLNGFTKDFEQLEAMYLVLKEEMRSRPSQKVKDALVLNLLVQIDLLNQHLDKLETEHQESEENKQGKKKSNA